MPNRKTNFLFPTPVSPTEDLRNELIATLYHHYIEHLAAWYDLCEHERPFETLVPTRALGVSVLFNAIIAFSAQHKALSDTRYEVCSTSYHSACVQGLLSGLSVFSPSLREDYLVAACLLRSYEILNADSRQEQRHLLGAYQISSTEEIDMTRVGLLQAGAWNYLREEITVALECRRLVRLNIRLNLRNAVSGPDSMHANTVTYILARVINLCFGQDESGKILEFNEDEWSSLNEELMLWRDNLPTTYAPYSQAPKPGNPFPSEWDLQPWHIAAAQYFLAAKTLLMLQNPNTQNHTNDVERLCGIAYTNENRAARVNAFGPMAFSKLSYYRQEMEADSRQAEGFSRVQSNNKRSYNSFEAAVMRSGGRFIGLQKIWKLFGIADYEKLVLQRRLPHWASVGEALLWRQCPTPPVLPFVASIGEFITMCSGLRESGNTYK
ncbi:hypothetical protein QM012_004172 [Aureobasidium pullulans]|uniref:Transcription factor domain-containing protein n=1 Tax=Aureobasidium pullulans TaxID=5580 RepID=A0ABR0TSE5_AURPU